MYAFSPRGKEKVPVTDATTPLRQLVVQNAPKPRTRDDVIHENERHIVSVHSPLPLVVAEALKVRRGETVQSSAVVERSEWAAMLVQDARSPAPLLFVWKSTKLPKNEDVFNLDLMAGPDNSPSNYFVRVYQNKQTPNAVSVLSVTANGKVRFWPQVNVNAVRNDVFLPLQKDEKISSISMDENRGFFVGTSIGRLFLVRYEGGGLEQGKVQWRQVQLRMSGGVLGALGSWFGYGGQPDHDASEVRSILALTSGATSAEAIVMTHKMLHAVSVDGTRDTPLWSCPLADLVSAQIQSPTGAQSGHSTVMIHLIDVQQGASAGHYYVLVASAAVNQSTASQSNVVKYTIHELLVDQSVHQGDSGRFKLIANSAVPYDVVLSPTSFRELFYNVHLTVLDGGPVAFISYHNAIVALKVPRDERSLDLIPFNKLNESIVGRGVSSKGDALFVSPSQGIVAVRQLRVEAAKRKMDGDSAQATKRPHVEGGLPSNLAEDAMQRSLNDMLSDALNRFIAAGGSMPEDVQLLVAPLRSQPEHLSPVVVAYASMMVDALPSNDLRWAPKDTATNALRLPSKGPSRHLTDKTKRYSALITFLHFSSLMPTLLPDHVLRLAEFGEKLAAASRVLGVVLEMEYEAALKLVNAAINNLLHEKRLMHQAIQQNLTPNDIFFGRVSELSDICPHLFAVLQAEILRLTNRSPQDLLAGPLPTRGESFETVQRAILPLIINVNTVLVGLFDGALGYREKNNGVYKVKEAASILPWTSNRPIRIALSGLIALNVQVLDQAGRLARNIDPMSKTNGRVEAEYAAMFESLALLSRAVLTGYYDEFRHLSQSGVDEERIKSVEKDFERQSSVCIEPFIRAGLFDRARTLAEDFQHFQSLIDVSQATEDFGLLVRYIEKFSQGNFLDAVVKHFVDRQDFESLFQLPEEYWPAVRALVSDVPHLAFSFDVALARFSDASKDMMALASEEKDDLDDRRLYLSLAKLSAICTDQSINDESPEEQLLQLSYDQEELHELWPEANVTLKPVPAEELISFVLNGQPTQKFTNFDKFSYAFRLYRHSTSLRSQEVNEVLLESIWTSAINQPDFSYIVVEYGNGHLNDATVVAPLRETLVFALATRSAAQDSFNTALFARIGHEFEGFTILTKMYNALLELVEEERARHGGDVEEVDEDEKGRNRDNAMDVDALY